LVNPKAVLFVNDGQLKIIKTHGFFKQGMGTND